MFESYLTIALRKLARERGYALINLASLALGLAGFLLLALYLRSELTYDHHHANYERIYRVSMRIENANGESQSFAATGQGFGPLLTKEFPQLGRYVRFQWAGNLMMYAGDREREWDSIYLVDPTFYDAFTIEPVYGSVAAVRGDPSAVAVSETFARFYYGDRNPIGETPHAVNGSGFKIALVYKDLPDNVHLRFDMLSSIAVMDQILPGYTANYATTLWNPFTQTYLLVPDDFEVATFDRLAAKFADVYMGERAQRDKTPVKFVAQRLDDLHFNAGLDMDQPTGNVFYLYAFGAVACFILIVACINYINLATARAMRRAKEIGMRKVLGASPAQLVTQFLTESIVLTAIALVLAFVLIYLALSLTSLGGLMGKEHLLTELIKPSTVLGALLIGAVVAVAAGVYPAVYLASISPLAALTTLRRSWRTGLSLRNGLVFVQLAISIGVIAATLLMIVQMRYVHDRPLGFDKENRLILTLRRYDVVRQLPAIRAAVGRQPGVVDTTTISMVPGTGSWDRLSSIESNDATMEPVAVRRLAVGLNFVDVMNLELIAGRAFDPRLESDVRDSVIVNESLVKRMGWREPIGKRVDIDLLGGAGVARVIGVVSDFHYASLREEIGPLVINAWATVPPPPMESLKDLYRESFIVVISGERLRETFAGIERAIRKFDRGFNLEPRFLDDSIDELYRTESNLMRLTTLFAGLCIVISVMGIFGLSAFMTEHRTKEIGVRKVLGASDRQILVMLSRSLLWLVAIAAVPASYACYRAMQTWLERFAYHAEIGPLAFVGATLLIASIALATVALQSRRTLRSSPIDALRYQ